MRYKSVKTDDGQRRQCCGCCLFLVENAQGLKISALCLQAFALFRCLDFGFSRASFGLRTPAAGLPCVQMHTF